MSQYGYVDLYAYKTDNFTGITDGGEWSGSTNATGSNNEIEVGSIWFPHTHFSNLDLASIDEVTVYFYPKCSRSGNFYATNLRWYSKVGDIKWYPANNSSSASWIENNTNFPTSYPSSPWLVNMGNWTVEHIKNHDLLIALKIIADSNALKQTAYLKGMYCRVGYTLNTYTISVATTGNGSVSGGGTGLTKGQTVNISATPNEGYVFAYWSDGDRNASRTVTVSGNITYTATFVPKLSVARSTYVQNGAEGYYVYTYVADTGNGIGRVQFPTWTNPEQDDIQPDWGNNSEASGTAGSWTINGLTYNYRYYVKVADHNNEYLGYNTHIYPYDLTGNQGTTGGVSLNMRFTATTSASPDEGGTVSPTSTTVDYGTGVTLTATPNLRYKFVHWIDNSGNIISTSNSFSATIINDTIYIAVFEKIPTYVTYDSIFNFTKWKNEGISSSNGIVSNITNTGFTLTCKDTAGEGAAPSPFFPVEPGKSYTIDIDISEGAWDVYIFFCNESGAWVDFADGPTNRFSNNTNWGNTFTAPDKEEVVKAQIRVDANGSGNTISFDNFRIFPAEYTYMSTSVAASDRVDIDSWSVPSPIREGFNFLGWNTKPDGSGEAYTSNSNFPIEDLTLYSQWERSIVRISTSVIGEGTISPTSAEIESGENLTFTVTPNESYGIYSITVNGTSIIPSESFTLTNITIDTIVEVVFKKIVPKIISVVLEKDNTLDGVIVQQGVNIIVKVIEQFEI